MDNIISNINPAIIVVKDGVAVIDELVVGIEKVYDEIKSGTISAISRNYIKVNHPYNLIVDRIHHTKLDILELPKLKNLPKVVDLRHKFQVVYDQGELGSCTANALCGLMGYDDTTLYGSRLFVYYNERKLENDISQDAGASLSDGVKTLQKYGVCQETEWPYDITKFATAPPQQCYTDALQHKALRVKNIHNDVTSMKTALAQGYPFVVGIVVYQSFESNTVVQTGMVPMPSSHDQELGGHAVVCVGYDDERKLWIMRNSWGTEWGDAGYFYLPYLYLLDSSLASDLWNIISVEKETGNIETTSNSNSSFSMCT
jgi:C1A family cysteine protease